MNRTFLVFLSWSIGHLPRLFLALAGALTSVVVVVSRVGDPATALGSAGSTENIQIIVTDESFVKHITFYRNHDPNRCCSSWSRWGWSSDTRHHYRSCNPSPEIGIQSVSQIREAFIKKKNVTFFTFGSDPPPLFSGKCNEKPKKSPQKKVKRVTKSSKNYNSIRQSSSSQTAQLII